MFCPELTILIDLALHASTCGVHVSYEPGVARVESEALSEFNFVVASEAEVPHALRANTQVPVWFEGGCADPKKFGGYTCVQFVGMSASAKIDSRLQPLPYQWIPCHLSGSELDASVVLQARRYTWTELRARQRLALENTFHSWIVELFAEPIATVSVFLTEAGEAALFDLWVAPHRRGLGIGESVAYRAVSEVFRMGAQRCLLQAVPKAVSLFEGIGFGRTTTLAMCRG